MKNISLTFVEFKIVNTFYSQKTIRNIDNALKLSGPYDDFFKVASFETNLKILADLDQHFNYSYIDSFDVVGEGAWLEYELPALFASNTTLLGIPSELNSLSRFDVSENKYSSWTHLADVNEEILSLFHTDLDICSNYIIFNYFFYRDLMEGGYLFEGYERGILNQRHDGL